MGSDPVSIREVRSAKRFSARGGPSAWSGPVQGVRPIVKLFRIFRIHPTPPPVQGVRPIVKLFRIFRIHPTPPPGRLRGVSLGRLRGVSLCFWFSSVPISAASRCQPLFWRLRGVWRLRAVSLCFWFSSVPISAEPLYVSRCVDGRRRLVNSPVRGCQRDCWTARGMLSGRLRGVSLCFWFSSVPISAEPLYVSRCVDGRRRLVNSPVRGCQRDCWTARGMLSAASTRRVRLGTLSGRESPDEAASSRSDASVCQAERTGTATPACLGERVEVDRRNRFIAQRFGPLGVNSVRAVALDFEAGRACSRLVARRAARALAVTVLFCLSFYSVRVEDETGSARQTNRQSG